MFTDFREIDWRRWRSKSSAWNGPERLERESDILRTLEHQLVEVEKTLAESENALKETERDDAVTRNKHEEAIRLLNEANEILAALPPEEAARTFLKLDAMRSEALGEQQLTVESCDNRQTDMREWLQKKKIDAVDEKIARLRDRIIDAMRGYKSDYPPETLEVDVAIESAGAYRRCSRGSRPTICRASMRFQQLLSEYHSRGCKLQAQLHREREAIRSASIPSTARCAYRLAQPLHRAARGTRAR